MAVYSIIKLCFDYFNVCNLCVVNRHLSWHTTSISAERYLRKYSRNIIFVNSSTLPKLQTIIAVRIFTNAPIILKIEKWLTDSVLWWEVNPSWVEEGQECSVYRVRKVLDFNRSEKFTESFWSSSIFKRKPKCVSRSINPGRFDTETFN